MSRFQWRVVVVCILLNVLDGFDVLVMSFTGKAVSAEWELTSAQLGLLLSAGLVGMALGAIAVAPWADRVGRRPIVLGCLVLAAAGMLLSSASQSAVQLGTLRVLTGVGIGGVLACSNVLSGEYASHRWRGLAVSLNSTGYAIGATLGGLLAVGLVDRFGWRSVFLAGGLATALAVPLAWATLPESLDFLLTRRPKGALERVNALARRMGQPALSELPETTDRSSASLTAGFRRLLDGALRRSTVLLWSAFFLAMSGFYVITSWTPTLLAEAGLSSTQSLTGGTLLNLGGIFGAAALGALAARFRLRHVLAGYLVVTAVLLSGFIVSTSVLWAALALGALIGVFVNGCVAGLYALNPVVYDASVRATGIGCALAVGRIGSIVAPTAAGAMLDAGWSPQSLYLVVGAIFVATGVLVLAMRPAHAAEPRPSIAAAAVGDAR
ncbi:MFS transporter [Streptomyces macrosporus]|uniref:MFS transporter n=2 Tax=Streptomyces macrosporus TaxID=44032 RepID=A0ABN3JCP1_9ACTN